MSFKIVNTIDHGTFCSWTVPESWESDGVLRWPKFQTETLRRDPLSMPEDSWETTNCILKRSNIRSFDMAEAFIKLSDENEKETNRTSGPAEQFPCYVRSFTPQSQTNGPKKPAQGTITNSIAKPSEACTRTQQLNPIPEAPAPSTNGPTPQLSELHSKLDTLTTIVTGIAQDQKILSRNQEIIMNKLTELSEQFDEFMNRPCVSYGRDSNRHYSSTFKPVSDKSSLDELEQSLKNEEFAEELRQYLSVLCGEGKGRAVNNAYALVDAMFDRHFLVECSWAGGSRSEISKICFKSYHNVIDFFFSLVYASDKQFTKLECYSFFQNILKNAGKRCESKMMRKSSQKRRRRKATSDKERDRDIPVLDKETAESLLEIIRDRDGRRTEGDHTSDEELSC